MDWGGCGAGSWLSGAIAWQNPPFSEENSDSADNNRSTQKQGASGEQVIEGCRFQPLGNNYTVIEISSTPSQRVYIWIQQLRLVFVLLLKLAHTKRSRGSIYEPLFKSILTSGGVKVEDHCHNDGTLLRIRQSIYQSIPRLQIYGRTLSLESSFYHIFIQVQKNEWEPYTDPRVITPPILVWGPIPVW